MGFEVLDRDGKSVASQHERGAIAAGARNKTKLSVTMANPAIVGARFFLTCTGVVCKVKVAGKMVDSAEIPFGIRTARWDVNTGFWINGQHVRLHGWGQKPVDEWPGARGCASRIGCTITR